MRETYEGLLSRDYDKLWELMDNEQKVFCFGRTGDAYNWAGYMNTISNKEWFTVMHIDADIDSLLIPEVLGHCTGGRLDDPARVKSIFQEVCASCDIQFIDPDIADILPWLPDEMSRDYEKLFDLLVNFTNILVFANISNSLGSLRLYEDVTLGKLNIVFHNIGPTTKFVTPYAYYIGAHGAGNSRFHVNANRESAMRELRAGLIEFCQKEKLVYWVYKEKKDGFV